MLNFFEFRRLLIGCSAELTNQKSPKFLKNHQKGKNMIWRFYSEYLTLKWINDLKYCHRCFVLYIENKSTAVYFKQVCYTGVCFYPPKQTLIWFPLCYKPLPKLDQCDHQMYEYIVWLNHPKFWQNDQLIQRQNADCLGQMPRIIPNFCVQRVLKPMYHEFCKEKIHRN